jgi:DNA repair photolyase
MMKYVLVYDNPDRPYVIGITFDTWEEVNQRMAECKARGVFDSDLRIVLENDPVAVWLKENKHLF